jgi:excisionase family DNA binding protein
MPQTDEDHTPEHRGPSTLMTVAEVGHELKLTALAVRHLIYAGKLRAYYLAGRRLRVRREDLDGFLRDYLTPVGRVDDLETRLRRD